MEIRTTFSGLATRSFAGLALCAASVAFFGCERKEKVLDVETPGGEVEVERSTTDGDVDVDVNRQP
jgi:diaminopimelate epimerase